jgi:hypothetical protein
MSTSESINHYTNHDIGYAPAPDSCEGVNSVDAFTAAALDAITAFAVLDPGHPSQGRPDFSGPGTLRVAPPG